jgi:hypothetical protein
MGGWPCRLRMGWVQGGHGCFAAAVSSPLEPMLARTREEQRELGTRHRHMMKKSLLPVKEGTADD